MTPYQQQIGTFAGWYWTQTTAAVGSFANGQSYAWRRFKEYLAGIRNP